MHRLLIYSEIRRPKRGWTERNPEFTHKPGGVGQTITLHFSIEMTNGRTNTKAGQSLIYIERKRIDHSKNRLDACHTATITLILRCVAFLCTCYHNIYYSSTPFLQ
jgi:hypothetical protein